MGVASLLVEHADAQPAGHLPRGAVLDLAAADWRYGEGPLTLRVEQVRDDLSQYYSDEVWVEGYRLDDAGVPVERLQALVRRAALPQR